MLKASTTGEELFDDKSTTHSDVIEKIATATLDGTKINFEIYRFKTQSGETIQAALRPSYTSKVSRVVESLLDMGLPRLPKSQLYAAVGKAIGSLATSRTKLKISSGWTEVRSKWAYVRGDSVITKEDTMDDCEATEVPEVLSALCYNGNAAINFVGRNSIDSGSKQEVLRSGSVKSWGKAVAAPATASTRTMLFISASFAGPALRIADCPPFTLVLTGYSTGGKTSSLLAAGSVSNFFVETSIMTWSTSDAGLEEAARLSADGTLFIDELATAGTPAEQHRLISSVAYRLSAGGKKTRQSNAMYGIDGRPPDKGVRFITLSTSELRLAALATAAKKEVPPGFTVRFIDVPLAESGYGVFDRLPDAKPGASDIDAAQALADIIKTGSAAHYGAVFDKWVRWLVDNPKSAAKLISKYRKSFIAQAEFDESSALERRHLDRFAVLYAAARCAILRHLLPWTNGQLLDAINSCHRASRSTLPKPKESTADGLHRLQTFMNDPKLVSKWSATEARKFKAWRKKTNDGRRYILPGDCYERIFSSVAQRNAVSAFLLAKGYTSRDRQNKLTRQLELPNGERVRCIIITMPSGESRFQD